MHTCVHSNTHIHAFMYIHDVCMYVFTYVNTYIVHTYGHAPMNAWPCMYVRTYVCMHAWHCMCVRTYVRTYKHGHA